jgi:uncharacterized protein YndB with AHSA1/START domain
MTVGPYGTVTNFDDNATVRFERPLNASREGVWRALTDVAAVSVWLALGTLDTHVGGSVHLDFGEDQQVAGTVLQCDPTQTLEYTWTFTGEQDSVLLFELSGNDERTTLVLEHRLLPPDQAVGYGAGWHAHLDMLDAHVTGKDPVDWDARFNDVLGYYAGA